MARRREVGTFKLGILSAALIGGLALSAQADDKKLTLSGSAAFTTDYMFRSVSQTTQEPAVQPEFDRTYGMWWAYMWGCQFPGFRKHRDRLRCRHLAQMGELHLHGR